MVEEVNVEKTRKTEYLTHFYTLAPRPIVFAETLHRFLEWRYGKPKEIRTGEKSEIVYNHDGTTITFGVRDTGVTSSGLETKVIVGFISSNKESFEKIISEKVWDNFNLSRAPIKELKF